MKIMPEATSKGNMIENRINKFLKRFHLNRCLHGVHAGKQQGVRAYILFSYLVTLVFTKKTHYQHVQTSPDTLPFKKDTVYRFLDRGNVYWEGIVQGLAREVIPEVKKLTSDERKTAFIIDDSPYYRNRSKKVELLSWQYDHSTGKHYKGFNMLNMGWSDGQTFIPVDFRLLSSSKDSEPICASKAPEDKRTLATRRRTEARTDKPSLVLKMLNDVRNTPIKARYVMFDSWFSCPSSIMKIKGMGYDVVARLKDHKNYRYKYQDQLLCIKDIYKMSKKRRGRSRYLLSVSVDVRHDDFPGTTVPANIVFIRDRNNRSKWIALISTDIDITEDEVLALYGKRWDIEPYHKMLKSCLRLTKEFELRSFDAIVAHTAIVISRYIFLALENREAKDERTMGELFLVICDELADISFAQALDLIMSMMPNFLCEKILLEETVIEGYLKAFFQQIHPCFKRCFDFALCES